MVAAPLLAQAAMCPHRQEGVQAERRQVPHLSAEPRTSSVPKVKMRPTCGPPFRCRHPLPRQTRCRRVPPALIPLHPRRQPQPIPLSKREPLLSLLLSPQPAPCRLRLLWRPRSHRLSTPPNQHRPLSNRNLSRWPDHLFPRPRWPRRSKSYSIPSQRVKPQGSSKRPPFNSRLPPVDSSN